MRIKLWHLFLGLIVLMHYTCFAQRQHIRKVNLEKKHYKKVIRYNCTNALIYADFTNYMKEFNDALANDDLDSAMKASCINRLKTVTEYLQKKDTFEFYDNPLLDTSTTAYFNTVEFSFMESSLDSGKCMIFNKNTRKYEKSIRIIIDTTTKGTPSFTEGTIKYKAEKDTSTLMWVGWASNEFPVASPEEPQLPTLDRSSITCLQGIDSAKADAAKGKLKIIISAMPVIKNIEGDSYSFRRHTLDEYLQDKYGITYEYKGYITSDKYDCYNQYMDSVIDARFGKDLDKKSQKTVDSMNAREQESALKFYQHWDLLIDSLCNSVNQSKCDSISGTIQLSLTVDIKANAANIKLSQGFCPEFEKKLIAIIKSLKWTPGTGVIGKKIACKAELHLLFKKRKLDKFDVYFY